MIETTPLRGNAAGEGWHLRPRRRYLFVAAGYVGVAALVATGSRALADQPVLAVGCFALAAAGALVPLERPQRRPACMLETPEDYGLLLPLRPLKVSLAVLFALLALALAAVPVGLLVVGLDGGLRGADYLKAALAVVVSLVLAVLFGAAAWAGVEGRRNPTQGVLLDVDGVVLRTQARPVRVPWHGVRAFRAHWRRSRPSGDLFNSPEDVVNNWFTVEAEPDLVEGTSAMRAFAGLDDPTFDAARLAMDPELALAVCRFYLADAEARAELRTPAALDRVASLARNR